VCTPGACRLAPKKPCPPSEVERRAHMTTAACTQRHVGPQACLQAVCTSVLARWHGTLARGLTSSHRALAHTCPCVQARAVLFASHYTYTPPYDTASTRPAASGGWPWPWSQRVTQGRTRGLWGESKATNRREDVSSSRMVGTVAPSNGATPPVLVGGCHGVMRPEEVAHLAHRLGNQVLGLLPGVDAYFGLRREAHNLHGHGIRVRRDVVRQDQ